MQSTDRKAFEDQIRVLCAGYNVPATDERIEAYWRGLQRMHVPQLVRAVDYALGEQGPEKLPTPKGLSALLHATRASAPDRPTVRPKHDPLKALGNGCLVRVLLRNRGVNDDAASDESLRLMIAAKNRIVDQARGTYGERELADDEADELSDVLVAAIEKLWQPRAPEEVAADIEHFQRTGSVRDTNLLL